MSTINYYIAIIPDTCSSQHIIMRLTGTPNTSSIRQEQMFYVLSRIYCSTMRYLGVKLHVLYATRGVFVVTDDQLFFFIIIIIIIFTAVQLLTPLSIKLWLCSGK
jgi:hypothetical protein